MKVHILLTLQHWRPTKILVLAKNDTFGQTLAEASAFPKLALGWNRVIIGIVPHAYTAWSTVQRPALFPCFFSGLLLIAINFDDYPSENLEDKNKNDGMLTGNVVDSDPVLLRPWFFEDHPIN